MSPRCEVFAATAPVRGRDRAVALVFCSIVLVSLG